jgi:Spy/CpxP family protein refolding chaperone
MEKSRLTRAHILLFAVSGAAVIISSTLYIRGVMHERQEEAEYARVQATRPRSGGGGNRRQTGARSAAVNPQQNGPQDAARRLEELTKELKLTPDQRAKIQKIQEAMAPRLRAIRNDASLSQEQRRGKMAPVRQETDAKIKQVLTPEQKIKYDTVQAQRRPRF